MRELPSGVKPQGTRPFGNDGGRPQSIFLRQAAHGWPGQASVPLDSAFVFPSLSTAAASVPIECWRTGTIGGHFGQQGWSSGHAAQPSTAAIRSAPKATSSSRTPSFRPSSGGLRFTAGVIGRQHDRVWVRCIHQDPFHRHGRLRYGPLCRRVMQVRYWRREEHGMKPEKAPPPGTGERREAPQKAIGSSLRTPTADPLAGHPDGASSELLTAQRCGEDPYMRGAESRRATEDPGSSSGKAGEVARLPTSSCCSCDLGEGRPLGRSR